MKKFLKQKVAADPFLRNTLELRFHGNSFTTLEEDGYYTKPQNKNSQQTIDSKLCLEYQLENSVKLDNLTAVDPEKQKILNTIFHFKSKKQIIEPHCVQKKYRDDNDSDNEKVFVLKSILKKDKKQKINYKRKTVQFGEDQYFLFDKRSPIIPEPMKTQKTSSRKKSKAKMQKRHKKIRSRKTVTVKKTHVYQNNYVENLTIAEQILLVKPAKTELPKNKKVRESQEIKTIDTFLKRKSEENPDIQRKKASIETFLDERSDTDKWKSAFSKKLPSRLFDPYKRVNRNNSHHKISSEILATLQMFENYETTEMNKSPDLQKKENERAENLTALDYNSIKKPLPLSGEWTCSVQQFYPQK